MTGALEARLTAAATVAAAADEDPAARPARRVVLVGPMGAGKTTVGRALAAVTGLP
ncbi:shikimate kinase, partial [Rhodococcus hoagii]|nr:shikimate kinase [Prescottella equi]